MQRIRIPHTDLEVSRLAMGCWAIASPEIWGPQVESDAIAAIHACLDAGINFFDTAEIYGDGNSERLLGAGLKGVRDETVIASKVSSQHLSAAALVAACEGSLRRLNTEYIDLYQVHWPNAAADQDAAVAALNGLVQAGKIRHYGVSNFGCRDLDGFQSAGGRPVTNQLPYSLIWRAIEFAVQPRCVADQVGILCYSPLASGVLTGKYAALDDIPDGLTRTRLFSGDRPLARHGEAGCEELLLPFLAELRAVSKEAGAPMADVAIAWLLARDGVVAAVAGARTRAQALRNAQALSLRLSPASMARLTDAGEAIKAAMGANIDPWDADGRSH